MNIRILMGKMAGALLLCGWWICPPALGEEQILLELRDQKDYGSGASISDDLYSPGGVPNVGLMIGEPNNQNRRDRVLLRYDIRDLLLQANRILSAELVFSFLYYVSPEAVQPVEIEHFLESLETLTGRDLNRPDVETVAQVEITAEDAGVSGEGTLRTPLEKTVDVTKALQSDLEQGLTTCSFRLKAPNIEGQTNLHPSHGLIVSFEAGQKPVLRVTLKN